MPTSTVAASKEPADASGAGPIRVVLGLLGSIVGGLAVAGILVLLIATQLIGFHALAIASDSMTPALNRGDLVLTRPVSIDSVKSGDIVAFDEGQTVHLIVVHRVAGLVNVTVNTTDSKTGQTSSQITRLLQTKGDANPATDAQTVGADRFRGLVFATIPSVGGVFGSGLGQGLLVSLAIGIAVTWLVYEGMRFRDRRSGAD